MDQHEVQTVNVDPVAAVLVLCQIDLRKLKLVAFEVLLDARIGHLMVPELRSDIVLDNFAPRVTNCREIKISLKRVRVRRSQQVLQTAFDRFENLERRDVRLGGKVELPDVMRLQLDFEDSYTVTLDDFFQAWQPGVAGRHLRFCKKCQ